MTGLTDSSAIYDALAPHYREYAAKRSAYLAAVDRFVVENIPAGAGSLLDVGAGDGVRGMDIARRGGIGRVALSDPSFAMVELCRRLGPREVWHCGAESLPGPPGQFDVILCLWNVLGHLPGKAARVRALVRMRELLAPGGAIFFDVNNRHNASAYGWFKVCGRIVVDALAFDERRGDATFDWNVGGRTFQATGHLFTPGEIGGIIAEAGLDVLRRASADYAAGRFSTCALRGQLLFMLGREKERGR